MAGGRALALDVGERYVGVAYSDEEGNIVFPDQRLDRSQPDFWSQLLQKCRAWQVQTIILGLPLTLRGEKGRQAEATEQFRQQLQEKLAAGQLAATIKFWDERLSSKEARDLMQQLTLKVRDQGEKGKTDEDSLAAYLILQAYLTRSKNAEP